MEILLETVYIDLVSVLKNNKKNYSESQMNKKGK